MRHLLYYGYTAFCQMQMPVTRLVSVVTSQQWHVTGGSRCGAQYTLSLETRQTACSTDRRDNFAIYARHNQLMIPTGLVQTVLLWRAVSRRQTPLLRPRRRTAD